MARAGRVIGGAGDGGKSSIGLLIIRASLTPENKPVDSRGLDMV